MPVFIVERQFAEKLQLGADEIRYLDDYERANDIKWITSFLSADQKKTFCLYEVADAEILRKHAADLGLPADAIHQVDEMTR